MDWTGNKASSFTTNGDITYSKRKRTAHDYYATDPRALELLLQKETFHSNVWECACGEGHLSEVLKRYGYNVFSTDLIARGYEEQVIDFLASGGKWDGDILTNPPYKLAKEFVFKALEFVSRGNRVCMFLKLTFLESVSRKELFDKYPPKLIYVSRNRLNCAVNGRFEKNSQSAVAYAWYIWEKGWHGEPIVRWFN